MTSSPLDSPLALDRSAPLDSPSRRRFLAQGGALVVSFALVPRLVSAQGVDRPQVARARGSLDKSPLLDSWIRIGADGSITVFTGKAELGQGVSTALRQIAADQLAVGFERIALVTADTARTPDEGYTAGSNSMKDSGTAIMHAAAQVRELLIGLAAQRFSLPPDRLRAHAGAIETGDGRRVEYGPLVGEQTLHVVAQPQTTLLPRSASSYTGRPIPRVDIPGKVTGGIAYVQDLRLPGMLHARVVRPPSPAAQLAALDDSVATKLPGVVKVVRNGRYFAVVAEHEYQAVVAMRALGDAARWNVPAALPPPENIYERLLQLPARETVIAGEANPPPGPGAIEATYRRPYQLHGSIGPSCALAQLKDGTLTLWTHSQGVYPLRAAIAELVGMPIDKVHCIHTEGSGCYGHNGADDAAADAALAALAVPDRAVRVQWMREHEHAWEPFGPAMTMRVRATLGSDGKVTGWQYDVWSNTHSMRPGKAGHLAAGPLLEKPFLPPPPQPLPQPEGGGDRNAIPLYAFGAVRVVHHFIPEMPLRVSALRALGAYANVFAIESFVDELATAAKADPVEFRLRHLEDPRAREVLNNVAQRFGWSTFQRVRDGRTRGRGIAFARYKNLAAYAAIAMDVEVDRTTGAIRIGRVVVAIDSGSAVNPDGIRNQSEGGVIQSLSWTLLEHVTWDATRITSRDWSGYPILRFEQLPQAVDVQVIDRPDQPFLGTGEAVQGPTAAALANAVADAIGVRIRDIPLDRMRIMAALGR